MALYKCILSFILLCYALPTAPPRFVNKPPPLIFVREGGNLSISISVSGNPVPKITWTLQDKNHENQTRYKVTADKFEIDDVHFEDEGVINCRAENLFGVQEAKVELTVLGELINICFEK